MAHSPRGWTGARTPSALKRVRQAERRHAINQPRRSAAKTLVGKALLSAGNGNADETREILARAISALDRAAKVGAIHPNAASRRKSRLTLKINAALGGEALVAGTRQRTTGKTAAAKEARARIAAGKAVKAKGAQTAAGKARAALARTTREAGAPAAADESTAEAAAAAAPAKPAAKKTTSSTKTRAATGAAKSASGATKSRATKAASEPAAAKPRSTRTAAKKS